MVSFLSWPFYYLLKKNRFIDQNWSYPAFSHAYQQGLRNQAFMPGQLNRLWPYWVYQQLEPESLLFQAQKHPLNYLNHSFRQWTSLRFPESPYTINVDPKGLACVPGHAWSLDHFVYCNQRLYFPSTHLDTEQHYHPGQHTLSSLLALPSLRVSCHHSLNGLTGQWAHGSQDVTLTNLGNTPLHFSFFFAIRPYTFEGVGDIHSLHFLPQNVFMVDGNIALILNQKPDNVVCSSFRQGNIADLIESMQMIVSSQCPDHQASAYAEYHISLDPHDSICLTAQLPLQLPQRPFFCSRKKYLTQMIDGYHNSKDPLPASSLSQVWDQHLQGLLSINLPDQEICTCFEAQKQHVIGLSASFKQQLSFTSLETVLFDTLYYLKTLLSLGASYHFDDLFHSFALYFNRFSFYQKLSSPRDLSLAIEVCCLLQTTFPDNVFSESLTPILLSWGQKLKKYQAKHPVTYPSFKGSIADCFSILNAFTHLAKLFPDSSFHQEAETLKYAIDQFSDAVCDTHLIPSCYPIDGTFFSDQRLLFSLNCISDYALSNPQSARITETLKRLQTCLKDDLYYASSHPIGFPIFDNFKLAFVYLKRRDPKLFNLINWFLEHASASYAWPERLHPISLSGHAGSGHCSLASFSFVHLLRNMLVQEEAKGLHLTPFIPDTWQDPEHAIRVNDCVTSFGSLSFCIDTFGTKRRLTLTSTFHRSPEYINISFPTAVTHFYFNGESQPVEGHTVSLPPDVSLVLFDLACYTHVEKV